MAGASNRDRQLVARARLLTAREANGPDSLAGNSARTVYRTLSEASDWQGLCLAKHLAIRHSAFDLKPREEN